MSNDKYKIIDDFQAGPTDIRVLVLDRDFDSFSSKKGGERSLMVWNISLS